LEECSRPQNLDGRLGNPVAARVSVPFRLFRQGEGPADLAFNTAANRMLRRLVTHFGSVRASFSSTNRKVGAAVGHLAAARSLSQWAHHRKHATTPAWMQSPSVFNKRNTHGPTSNCFVRLLAERVGTVWACTENGGFMRYLAGSFQTFSVTNGLPYNSLGEARCDLGSASVFVTLYLQLKNVNLAVSLRVANRKVEVVSRRKA